MTEEHGKSSEVEEQDLSQEVLDATGEKAPLSEEAEPTVPLHKHTALRQRAQDAERGKAFAEGQLSTMQQLSAQQAPPAKSPLELEVERQAAEGIAEEDMVVSPAIIRADKLHDQQVANQTTKVRVANELATKQAVSMNAAKVKHEDWQTVCDTAEQLLTPGEYLDIKSAGADFGEKAYRMCQVAIERNKPATETALKNEEELSKSEAKAKADAEAKAKETVKTQDEKLNDPSVDPMVAAAAQL